jgi:hypothetical protein
MHRNQTIKNLPHSDTMVRQENWNRKSTGTIKPRVHDFELDDYLNQV